jgi:hypothetical protein
MIGVALAKHVDIMQARHRDRLGPLRVLAITESVVAPVSPAVDALVRSERASSAASRIDIHLYHFFSTAGRTNAVTGRRAAANAFMATRSIRAEGLRMTPAVIDCAFVDVLVAQPTNKPGASALTAGALGRVDAASTVLTRIRISASVLCFGLARRSGV